MQTQSIDQILIDDKEIRKPPKIFEEPLLGTDIKIPLQFYIPEEFAGKQKLIERIEDQGGVILEYITPLTIQIMCIPDIGNPLPPRYVSELF